MKIRIGLSTGTETRTTEDLVALADDIATLGFDSLWMPEILTLPGGDPLVGLAFISGRVPSLKVGTTMLVPGRNLVRLAKQVATLDTLSQGRLLLTLVPGIARGAERRAVGVDPAQRGQILDDALPVLRRLWAGETVSHHGPAGEFEDVTLDPRPVQEPFEVWLGGLVPAALRRCGRLADGWLPALCTPEEAAAGRVVVEESAAQAERAISAEHYGVSVLYVEGDGPDAEALARLRMRSGSDGGVLVRGHRFEELVPHGLDQLRHRLEQFVEVGFSKFVVRSLTVDGDGRAQRERLAAAVGDLQT